MLNRFNFNWLGFEKFSPETTRTRLHYWEGDAIVDEAILPLQTGWIRFKGTLWKARCGRQLELVPGDRVQVIARRNSTLMVEPFPAPN